MPRKTSAAPKQPTYETIDERAWLGRQSRDYVHVFRATGPGGVQKVLQVTVHDDTFYDFQSYANIKVQQDDQWHEVHSIAGQVLDKHKSNQRTLRPVEAKEFEWENLVLRDVACEILGLKEEAQKP
jgi:hypothetical protein